MFRCLAGLWSIKGGQITKPRGTSGNSAGNSSLGLAGTVFYLPQKPYNVLGTLADQLTYPEQGKASSLSLAEVKSILDEVDLGYLAERPDILTKETNWEEECSLVRSNASAAAAAAAAVAAAAAA